MVHQYQQVPIRGTTLEDYTLIKPLTALQRGSFVVVKRPRSGGWSAPKSAGPYIVLEDSGESATIMSLATGRVEKEAKTNLSALRGWVRLREET